MMSVDTNVDIETRLRRAAGAANDAVAGVEPPESLPRLARAQRRKPAVAIVSALTMVATVAVVAGVVVVRRGDLGRQGEWPTDKPSAASVPRARTPTNGRIVARIPLDSVQAPVWGSSFTLRLDGGDIWLYMRDEGLVRIDPASHRRRVVVEPGELGDVHGIWPVGGALWVHAQDRAVSRLVRVDPSTGAVAELVRSSGDDPPVKIPSSVVTVAGTVWGGMLARPPGRLTPGEGVARLDPATGGALQTVPYEAIELATDGTELVALAWDAKSVARIDPRTGTVAELLRGSRFQHAAVGAGAVWVSDTRGTVTRVDLATRAITRIKVSSHVLHHVTFGAGSVWAMDAESDVFRIDPATNRVAGRVPGLGIRHGLPHSSHLAGIDFTSDALWASAYIGQKPYLLRIDPYG
jgi:hypothetical protein